MARATGRRKTAELSALAPILVITGMKREAACVAGEGVIAALQRRQCRASCAPMLDALAGTALLRRRQLRSRRRPWTIRCAPAISSSPTPSSLATIATRPTNASLTCLQKASPPAGCKVVSGAIVGVDQPAMDRPPKPRYAKAPGRRAVDMESHLAAEFARATGDIPFVVVRAISDPAARALPPLVAKALTPDGDICTHTVSPANWFAGRVRWVA